MTDEKPDRRRFARVYYDDLERDYPGLFYDPTTLSTWLRLLILSEKAWPALPELPRAARRADLEKLVSLGILEHLDHSRFALRGWVKDREVRAAHGRNAVESRSDRGTRVSTRVRTRVGTPDVPAGARPSPSTSISTSQTERVQGEPIEIFAMLARAGAFLRPDSGLGVRLVQLIDRRGFDVVNAEVHRVIGTGARLSDRQWVFGLEKALEAIPDPEPVPDARAAERQKLRDRQQEDAAERRLHYFAETGKWDPAFGPEPKWKPEWGERPAA